MSGHFLPTSNDIFLNWNSFVSNTWKRSTLRTLIKRAYLVCLFEKHLVDELKHLEFVFEKYSNFPKWVIDQVLNEVQSEDSNIRSPIQDNQIDVKKTADLLVYLMPVRKVKNGLNASYTGLKCVLPKNVTTGVTYLGTRLSSNLQT